MDLNVKPLISLMTIIILLNILTIFNPTIPQNGPGTYTDPEIQEPNDPPGQPDPYTPQTITVTHTINLNHKLDARGDTYIRGTGLGDYAIFMFNGDNIQLKNVTIDDGNYIGLTAAVFITGNNNSIVNSTLQNCLRYGIATLSAHNFYIGYNTVTKAQYCISGSGGTSTNGTIEYNNLSGMTNCGIKVKNLQNTTIQYNDIDIACTFTGRNPIGVNFSDDTPNVNQNNQIKYNTITRTTGLNAYVMAFTMDVGCQYSGNTITNNTVINDDFSTYTKMYPMIIRGDNFTVTDNDFTQCLDPINSGDNNTITPNTYN